MSRRPQLAAISTSLQKDDRPCARVLAPSCILGAMKAHRCGEPWTTGPSRRGTAQAFSSIAALYTWMPALMRPISGALSGLGPNVDDVVAGFKDVKLLHALDALRARVTVTGRTPRAWRGVPSATVPNVGVGEFSGDEGPLFRRAAVPHRCGPWGRWYGSPNGSRVAWTLNK